MYIRSRFQAFGVHLLGSTTIAVLSAALVYLLWYRWPIALAAGVSEIFLILLAVDVIMGPVITLIVFDRKKKELRRDLLIVLLLQLSALAYGMHTVFIARPAYMVFAADRFELVYANALTPDKLDTAPHQFKTLPLGRPEIIAVRRPDDAKARQELILGALTTGEDIQDLPQYYVPYAEQKILVLSRLQDMATLKDYNQQAVSDVGDLVAKYAQYPGGVGFLPVRGKVRDLTAVVSRDSAEVLELVPLNPWP
jgi:hypothetical protein